MLVKIYFHQRTHALLQHRADHLRKGGELWARQRSVPYRSERRGRREYQREERRQTRSQSRGRRTCSLAGWRGTHTSSSILQVSASPHSYQQSLLQFLSHQVRSVSATSWEEGEVTVSERAVDGWVDVLNLIAVRVEVEGVEFVLHCEFSWEDLRQLLLTELMLAVLLERLELLKRREIFKGEDGGQLNGCLLVFIAAHNSEEVIDKDARLGYTRASVSEDVE